MPSLDLASTTRSRSPSSKSSTHGSRTEATERDSTLLSMLSQDGGQHRSTSTATSGDKRQAPLLQKHLQKKKSKKKRQPITANLAGTRYDVVRQVVEHVGFTVSKNDDPNSYLIWFDSFVSTDRISELKPYQRLNHFPGMGEICRKDCLARNMFRMSKVHPEEYNFLPQTWIFPAEFNQFQNYIRELKKKKKQKTFIIKPANGAMGNGISLSRTPEKIAPNDHTIVQEYMDKPFLLEGYKFDLRIYVVVTSCDPLKIFLFNDGLVRLTTEKYTVPTDNNTERLYMHLTNYSVNKHSENYDKSGSIDSGTKRTLQFLNHYLQKNDYDIRMLWRNIEDIIIKTMIVATPHLLHSYKMCRPGQAPGSDSVCFEILGFDVMLDKKLKPWLIEINRSPSFGTDEKLDFDIKSGLLEDTLRLVNVRASDKRRNMAAQKLESQKRLLRPRGTASSSCDFGDLDKKRHLVEKRKMELKELLSHIRKEAAREEFENSSCNRLKRIFPHQDRFRQEKYTKLLHDAFGTFLAGRATSLQKDIDRSYHNTLREEDVLDMLAQCEADEKDGHVVTTGKKFKPQPLHGMPESRAEIRPEEAEFESHSDGSEDMEDDDIKSQPKYSLKHGIGQRHQPTTEELVQNGFSSRPQSSHMINSSRPLSAAQRTTARAVDKVTGQRSRSLSRPTSSTQRQSLIKNGIPANQDATEDFELTKKTMVFLYEMRIKFPGKTDQEADFILNKLKDNWKFHKPRIASYWLIKLDSIKRRKVIDIVRSNVRAVLQRNWKQADIDSLHLNRIFGRVFNRLLWSHGQGLWNCFSTSGNSWETIFSKSTEVISEDELMCCRRIVHLCQDCLLIVYQFATEAKGPTPGSGNTPQPADTATEDKDKDNNTFRMSTSGVVKPQLWMPSQTVNQRISHFYQNRQHSYRT